MSNFKKVKYTFLREYAENPYEGQAREIISLHVNAEQLTIRAPDGTVSYKINKGVTRAGRISYPSIDDIELQTSGVYEIEISVSSSAYTLRVESNRAENLAP